MQGILIDTTHRLSTAAIARLVIKLLPALRRGAGIQKKPVDIGLGLACLLRIIALQKA